jgi:uncharacterized protein (DUF2267 family)
MDEDTLVSRIQGLAGFAGRAEAMRALRATVMALGESLEDDERAALGRHLPASLHAALDRCAYVGDLEIDDLFARVAHHEHVARGFAVEHAEVVCRALAERLPSDALARLRREVRPSVVALFDVSREPPSVPRTTSTSGTTLASGREGSRHPVSEARLDMSKRS